MSEAILAAVGAHYEATLARHGATAKGVDWKDDDGHRLRHRQFLRLIEHDPEASILDMGCGYGDFLPFLRSHGHRGRYIGTDIAPAMVEAARARHGEGPDRAFVVGTVAAEPVDYAIGSGILNVIRGADAQAWARYVEATIDALAAASTRGFGFNMLSLNSDPERRRADLHYADPAAMLAQCLARFGRHAAVLQDYGLWEFTLLMRHPPSQTASPKPVAP
jgi:SAM-dependent methyltransferase